MTKAITIFEEMKIGESLQTKILELDPDFNERDASEQREIVGYLLEQAQKTTEGVRSRFPIIAIKHGGTTKFEMPREIGEEEQALVGKFEGVILDQYLTKAYWENEDQANGAPPDCASLDAVNPYVDRPVTTVDKGGCISCPFNKFGSATKGRGKRCRDVKRVIVSLEGHELPVRLQVSAANLKPFDSYLSDLRDQGLTIGSVLSTFHAIEARNAAGTEYTGLELSTVRKLVIDEVLDIKRNKVDPYKDDFRLGQLEAGDAGEGESNAGPDESSVAAGKEAAKAGDLM